MKRLKKLSSSNNIRLLLFGLTFLIYLTRISPSVYGADSGDFLSAALTKGVPHPSGFPLYTMIGILFLEIPINATPAWKFGLFSAIISSISVVVLYEITMLLTKNKYLSFLTALSLAFIYPFWIYAQVVEVFAFNSFFILCLVYLTLKYHFTKQDKYLLWISLTFGLSMSSNQVILLILPGIIFLVLATKWRVIKNFKLILKSLMLFIVGLLPYVYIPISASRNPVINWGNAVNFKNFIYTVTRRLYGWGNPSTAGSRDINIGSELLIEYWNAYMPLVLVILSFLGIIYLILKYKKRLLTYILINFILFGPFFLIYGHKESPEAIFQLAVIERFIVQSAIFVIILSPFAILLLKEIVQKFIQHDVLKKASIFLIKFSYLIIVLTILIVNYFRTDFSEIRLGDKLGKDILDTAPEDAILLLEADQYLFNSLYYQIAYDHRTDISIPSAQTSFSKLIEITPELSAVTQSDDYFIETQNLIDSERLLFSIVIGTNRGEKIFINQGNTFTGLSKNTFIKVPYGLLERLYLSYQEIPSKEEYIETIDKIWDSYDLEEHFDENLVVDENMILSDIRGIYIINLLSTADFIERQYQDPKLAQKYRIMAFSIDPIYLIRFN